MNRGVLQMMAENPNWWNTNTMRPPVTHHQNQQASAAPSQFLQSPTTFFMTPTRTSTSSSSSSSSSSLPVPSWHDNQELPHSWSQLLLGGLVGEEEKGGDIGQFQAQPKKLENWEEHVLHQVPNIAANSDVDVKQENSASSYVYGLGNEDFQHSQAAKPAWFHQISSAASSPRSSVTSFSSNMLDFSGNKTGNPPRQPPPDRSSECNSTTTGGPLKKARVQPSASQSTLKVRKEKLGDRITSLHQLVSPFGKTDTASVLSESIGYIRFLQSQIEALSLPYLGNNGSPNMRHQHQQSDCEQEEKKDLRSRGLCLVPVSCTLEVWSGDNGADYWAPPPSLGAGLFR